MPRPRLASQRVMATAARELAQGRKVSFISLGTSMTPAISVVQRVTLRPVRPREVLTGQIALSRVGGRFWLHRVTAERSDDVLIGADNGMVNGWTPRSAVFGVLP